MRLGLFMNFEHGSVEQDHETSENGFARQIGLALKAEELGFEELWVSEHHFSTFTQSGSALAIMAYLAGRTQKIRLGSAALLTPLYNPIRLAEDLATIDILSHGRLALGLAKGGPFPSQFEHFQIDPKDLRERANEASALLLSLLERENVSFQGQWYQAHNLTSLPRPLQKDLPVFIASGSKENIILAGQKGHGLLAGHGATGAALADLLKIYADEAQGQKADLVVLRNVCVADTDSEALAIGKPAMERFFGKMRQHINPGTAYTPVPADKSLETAIIGSPETCREKLAALLDQAPISSIVLKIAARDTSMADEIMHRFRSEILPLHENSLLA